jgi:lysozyme
MKKKRAGRLLLILMAATAAVAGAWFWWQQRQEALNFVRYEEFGIDMPVNYSIHGIDVSKFQREIN